MPPPVPSLSLTAVDAEWHKMLPGSHLDYDPIVSCFPGPRLASNALLSRRRVALLLKGLKESGGGSYAQNPASQRPGQAASDTRGPSYGSTSPHHHIAHVPSPVVSEKLSKHSDCIRAQGWLIFIVNFKYFYQSSNFLIQYKRICQVNWNYGNGKVYISNYKPPRKRKYRNTNTKNGRLPGLGEVLCVTDTVQILSSVGSETNRAHRSFCTPVHSLKRG